VASAGGGVAAWRIGVISQKSVLANQGVAANAAGGIN